jgi:hypothetical protein
MLVLGLIVQARTLGNNFANVLDNLHVPISRNAHTMVGILVVHKLISMLARYNLIKHG